MPGGLGTHKYDYEGTPTRKNYLIKDGSGPFVSASEHVYFTSNKTVIKIFTNVDGKSWLNEPIPLEGSTANTVSPFVVLN